MLATVFGDVHDIGKNLVGTILSNNGYRVVDLGRQVPLNVIMDSAVAEHADAVGLSALLVSTSRQMPLALHELDHRGLHVPVLVGGAAINRAFGRRIAFLDDGRMYEPGRLLLQGRVRGARGHGPAERRGAARRADRRAARARRWPSATRPSRRPRPSRRRRVPAAATLRADVAVPEPPFLGARLVDAIDPAAAFALMDERSLYKLSWGGKGVRGDEWERLLADDFRPRRARMQAEAVAQGWIVPRAAYGFFRGGRRRRRHGRARTPTAASSAASSSPARIGTTGCASPTTCARRASGRDVIALQIVTAGAEATEHIDALQAAGEYSEAYFAHGLAVEAAEGLAEYVHRRILAELGLEAGRGRRYSWGYPACPDLEQHELVLQLLPAGGRARHRALRGLPVHPRADDGRDRHPPSPGASTSPPAAASAPAVNKRGQTPFIHGRARRMIRETVGWLTPRWAAIWRLRIAVLMSAVTSGTRTPT